MTSPFKPAYLFLPDGGRAGAHSGEKPRPRRKDSKIFFSEEKKQKTFIFLCGTT